MSESLLTDYDRLCRQAVADLAQTADGIEVPSPAARFVPGGTHAFHRPMEPLAIALFDPASPSRGRQRLWQRLADAIEATEQSQHDDGLIDLTASNFHSPPDTAFMVEDLVPLYEVVRDTPEPSAQRDEFLTRLEAIIVKACGGIARGGVHTPNHRWKVASALVLADGVWPHESWRAEAQAYLDEGIDIDADGEYGERSAGCYDYVCGRSMILLSRAMGKPAYMEFADRNLEHLLGLLHADGTMVTSYSRRQDRHTTVGVERYLLLYWYRAMTSGNGRFLSAAELGLRRLGQTGGTLAGLAKWLRYFPEAGRCPAPEAETLGDDYEVRFGGCGVLRRRRGDLSLTLMPNWDDVLAVRFGAGPEVTVRIAAGLAPRGQFVARQIEGGAGRYRMRSRHACEYYGPGPDRLPAVDRHSRASFSRRVFVGTELTMELAVEMVPDGLRLRLDATGCPRVPVEVAFIIRDAEPIAACDSLQRDDGTGKWFLDAGDLVVTGRQHTVRIGPGACEHDLKAIPASRAYPTANACCVRLVSPVSTALEIRVVDGG